MDFESDEWRKFFGKLELDSLDEMRKSAIGWTVLSIDMDGETPTCPFGHGLHSSPEDALLAAISYDENDRKWGDEGWTHLVVPILPT